MYPPVITYGCKTWVITRRCESNRLLAQQAMQRAMLGITRRDKKRNDK